MIKPAKQQDKIDLSSSMTLVEQLVSFIMNDIKKSSPGDKILPERALAEKYNVSRKTVKGAVARLTEQGLLERRVGKGTFVTAKLKEHADIPVNQLIYTADFPHPVMNEIIDDINSRQELVVPSFFYGDYRVFDLYEEAVKHSIESEKNIDLISLDEGILPILAEEGILAPLDDLLEQSSQLNADFFHPVVLKAFTYKNQLYGLPQTFTTYGLFYNKAMFKAHHIDFPDSSWCWDDLIKAAEALTVKNPDTGSNKSFGLGVFNFNQNIFSMIIQQNIPPEVDLDTINAFTRAEAVEAIEWFKNIYSRNLSPPLQSYDWMTPAKMFSAGTVAMFIGSYSDYLELVADCNHNFGIAELPGQKRKVNAIPVQGWGICSHSSRKLKVFNLLEQLLDERRTGKIADKIQRIAAIHDLERQNIPEVFINSLNFAVSSSTIIEPTIEAKKVYRQERWLLLNNCRTPAEFCHNMAKFSHKKT